MNDEYKSALIRVMPFALVLLIIIVRLRKGNIDPAPLALQRPAPASRFVNWIFGYLAFVLLSEFALYQSGLLEVSRWRHTPGPSVIRIFGAVVLAPITEELIIRGFLLSFLVKRMNIPLSILIQSALFVLLHSFTYQNTVGSNIGIAQGLIDATLFALARFDTKSIYTPIVMHMIGNTIATTERFLFFAI